MHVTQQVIHSLLKQLDFIGVAGMCPTEFKIIQRSLTQVVCTNVQSLIIENKQIKSDLSYLGMT